MRKPTTGDKCWAGLGAFMLFAATFQLINKGYYEKTMGFLYLFGGILIAVTIYGVVTRE